MLSEEEKIKGRNKELEVAIRELRIQLLFQKNGYEQLIIDAAMFSENRHLHPEKSFQAWLSLTVEHRKFLHIYKAY